MLAKKEYCLRIASLTFIYLFSMFGRTYAMASIMSMPSSTQQWAWSGASVIKASQAGGELNYGCL
jgi:hypothetical protein